MFRFYKKTRCHKHLVFLCHQFDNYQIIRTFALSKLFIFH
ncbi:hypothetical protein HMPREF9073_00752 [Capnocytophaga sp. oral taxon 326 str. F0382]|nr:hypothetical protein HMPREF9073_00752 [Capnocytophaga sp. oral taxon 326 str. F0382]